MEIEKMVNDAEKFKQELESQRNLLFAKVWQILLDKNKFISILYFDNDFYF